MKNGFEPPPNVDIEVVEFAAFEFRTNPFIGMLPELVEPELFPIPPVPIVRQEEYIP